METENERVILAAEIERHALEEEKILQEYHTFSDELPEGLLAVLVNHIATEEEMHHFLLRTLAEWLRSAEAVVPRESRQKIDMNELLKRTELLREHEQQTIDACRSLKFGLSDDAEELLEVVLDSIALDSEKHKRFLGLVESLIAGPENPER